MATISYCRKVFINKNCDKFSLLLGEAQLCLPYVCLLQKIAFSYPKMTYSYLKVTKCYPNVNYSGLKVTYS